MLMERVQKVEEGIAISAKQVMTQNEVIHCDIKGTLSKLTQEQKNHIDTKFSQLEASSF